MINWYLYHNHKIFIMNKNSKIYIAGHRGLVGSAIVSKLQSQGCTNLILKTHKELDLLIQKDVNAFFKKEKPEYVFLAAAKVGGILANSMYPADFLYENLQVQNNVMHAAHTYKVKKLLFLGSSCIYPKLAKQPIKEEYLLSGPLEKTNEAYAIAKIAGVMMCKKYKEQYDDNFISIMPTNLYGPRDNFHPKHAHAMPMLIMKFIEAKKKNAESVTIWGTGKPKREFLYIDDLADAAIFLMNNYNGSEHLNIGTGEDISILELVNIIKDIVGFKGDIVHDTTKPDGTPRKLLDVSNTTKIGWTATTSLKQGIKKTIEWYLNNSSNIKSK